MDQARADDCVLQVAAAVVAQLIHAVPEAHELLRIHLDLQVITLAAVELANLLLSEDRLAVLKPAINLGLERGFSGCDVEDPLGRLISFKGALTLLIDVLMRKELLIARLV